VAFAHRKRADQLMSTDLPISTRDRGQSVWSERFECDLADGTSAHDDIAARVAKRVRQSVRARAS
jgi:TolB-like protein